ncbi:MAG TPA: TonB-dependent receptor, partial [Sphingomicrobium sp.]|nr:TonB-dependent receptor [Sphingomicrobium sp.]
FTVDYFNIKVKNVIGTATFEDTIQACFDSGSATSPECALVHRAGGTGSLWLGSNGFVLLPTRNFADQALETKGFDFQGNYSRRLGGWGTLNASFVGTLLTDESGAGVGAVGSFAGLQPAPKWRHTARLGLTMPNGLGISGRWRHFSAVTCDPEVDSGCDNVDGVLRPGNLKLSAADFFDLTLTARLAQRLNLRLGANNIFDTDPPVAGSQVVPAGFGNGNTFPQVYDSLGRYLFAGFTVDF